MAAPPIPITLTPYDRRYRQSVRDLMFRNYQVHTHLDWYDTDYWLNNASGPMRLAWQRGRLVGLLAASLPLNQSSWIRLAGLHDQAMAEPTLQALWDALLADLHVLHTKQVSVLVMRDWIEEFLPPLGFTYREDVITLRRTSRDLSERLSNSLQIRSFFPDDLEAVTRIDQSAFPPPWQLPVEEIRQATRMAAISTVALQSERLVGFQVSTFYYEGGHLARLAVAPDMQGAGVGRALLSDLIQRFARRGIYALTVNTQSTNMRSRHLYERFDFQPTGYNLPVWTTDL